MRDSYQSSSLLLNRMADDDRTKVSYDSLAYSDATATYSGADGRTTVSSESYRLNGPLVVPTQRQRLPDGPPPPLPRHYNHNDIWYHQPKIRMYFVASFIFSVATLVLVVSGTLDSEWLDHVWNFGLGGARAQRSAEASLIRTFDIHNPGIHLGGKSHKKEEPEVGLGVPPPPIGCETTVMLLRHCEKGSIRSHCNYNGFERASYLASLFGDGSEKWPAPSSLYALKADGRGHKGRKVNYREVETLDQVANKVGLEINTNYTTSDDRKMTRRILTSVLKGEQCGKLTVICWKHSDIPKLAQLLGCGPLDGCPFDYRGKEFDQVWQIRYVYRNFHTHKPHWDVFGSVQYENFDSLAFSKKVGDYPHGGTSHGGRWANSSLTMYDK